jgi:hypothetical protein
VDNRFKPKADGARWGDMIDRAVINPIDGSYRQGRSSPLGDRLQESLRRCAGHVQQQHHDRERPADLLPLEKSEVLDICEALDVPKADHQVGPISRTAAVAILTWT